MSATLFDYSELAEATDGFSAAWALGGCVYGAVLEGESVAVKRLQLDRRATAEEVLGALANAGRVSHLNLVPLRGVAVLEEGDGTVCVVTPLRRGGSLADRLARRSAADSQLTALQRVSLAVGAGRGLRALHAAGVAHRRIKSANLLLDDASLALSEAAQLVDGGLPLSLAAPENPAQDGYLDPTWGRRRALDAPADVYAFGVLLLELLTSKPAFSARGGGLVVAYRLHTHEGGALAAFADRSPAVDWPAPAVEDLAQLADRCLAASAADRPGMAEVVRGLERLEAALERRVAARTGELVGSGSGPLKPGGKDGKSFGKEGKAGLAKDGKGGGKGGGKGDEKGGKDGKKKVDAGGWAEEEEEEGGAMSFAERFALIAAAAGDAAAAAGGAAAGAADTAARLLSDPSALADAAASAAAETSLAAAAAPRRLAAAARRAAAGARRVLEAARASPEVAEAVGALRSGDVRAALLALQSRLRARGLAKSFTGGTEQLCVVCLDAPRETRLTACGHFALCVACAGQLERRRGRCPLCRAAIAPNGWREVSAREAAAGGDFSGVQHPSVNDAASTAAAAAAAAAAEEEASGDAAARLREANKKGLRDVEVSQLAAAAAALGTELGGDVREAFRALMGGRDEGAQARAKAVQPLVQLLWEGGWEGRAAAARALRTLAEASESSLDLLHAAGAVEALCALLREGEQGGAEAAAGALAALAPHPPAADAMAAYGAIEPLTFLLEAGSAAGKEGAARCMRALARSRDHAPLLAAFGAIPLLVSLLARAEPESQTAEAVAWTLAAVCEGGESAADRQAAVGREAEGVPSLVRLLTQGGAGGREAAAAAVRQLAGNGPGAQEALGGAGCVGPLVQLLWEGGAGAREQAAGALRALAAGNPQLGLSAVAAGAIEPLSLLLREGSTAAKEEAARALEQLAAIDASTASCCVAAGAVPPLVGLLWEDSLASSREAAAAALWRLVVNSRVQALVSAAGAVGPLVSLLRTEAPAAPSAAASSNAASAAAAAAAAAAASLARTQAARCIWKVCANNRAVQLEVLRGGAAPPLVAMLASHAEAEAEAAAAAVWALAGQPAAAAPLHDAGALPQLSNLLRAAVDSDAAAKAAWALRNLGEDADCRLAIGQTAGCLAALVEVLDAGTREGREGAARALRALCAAHENRRIAADLGAVQALSALLVQPGGGGAGAAGGARIREAAAGAIASLGASDSLQLQFAAAPGVLDALVSMLEPPRGGKAGAAAAAAGWEAREAAAAALAALAWHADTHQLLMAAGALPRLLALLVHESCSLAAAASITACLDSLFVASAEARAAAAEAHSGAVISALARLAAAGARLVAAEAAAASRGQRAAAAAAEAGRRAGDAAAAALRSIAAGGAHAARQVAQAREAEAAQEQERALAEQEESELLQFTSTSAALLLLSLVLTLLQAAHWIFRFALAAVALWPIARKAGRGAEAAAPWTAGVVRAALGLRNVRGAGGAEKKAV